MHRRVARVFGACFLLAVSLWCAIGQANATEIQKSDPEQCREDGQACVEAWYKEYSAGLIGELKYYAGQEDFLADMLADRQEPLITARLSLLLIEGGVKYSQWAMLKDGALAESAHLDMPRYHAIIGVCRDAISGMRTALFDLRQRRDAVRAEANQYLKDATACERALALAPKLSRLRSPGRPARATAPPAATGDATSGPMDIVPSTPRP
ncbi:hypothetical protein SAMN05519103_01425 [Rhizobiales bacterium GAS113]|jgi:hypothetical protein|nr:hypothetical protein SAMN05519103_01425 [Rhizobiales bacterium GAS113]